MSNDVLGEQGANGDNAAARDESSTRIKQYKNLSKHEDMRRRRTECSVELRKAKRDDMMMKRRNLVDEEEEDPASLGADSVAIDTKARGTGEKKPEARLPFDEVIRILSNNPSLEQTREAFESIRRALSKNKNPPVDEVIQTGLLHALVQALAVEDDTVRFEAAWGLTNILSGTSEQTMKAVEAGCTQPLVALTVHPNLNLAEQALWGVANIAGDSAQLRDYIIQCQGVEALLAIVERIDDLSVSFARTLAWAFSNMCRHKNPHAPIPVLSVLIRGLAKLIHHADKTVRQDACWAISYLTDGPDEQIELAKNGGVMPTILSFLNEPETLVAPALRVLGNMATGNDSLTQHVIDLGTLNMLQKLVDRSKSTSIVKEVCWLISNVIAGTQAQIQAVADAGLFSVLVQVLASGDYKVQFETSWALANLAQGGTTRQLLELFSEQNLFANLCPLLYTTNADLICNLLETMYAVLAAVATGRPDHIISATEAVEEAGGCDALEALQSNENEKIYHLSYKILTEFFSEDDEEEEVKENTGVRFAF